jgi:MoxR-like ATPase
VSQQPTPGHESAPPDPSGTVGGSSATGAAPGGGIGRAESGGAGWATTSTPFGNGATSGDDVSGPSGQYGQREDGSAGTVPAAGPFGPSSGAQPDGTPATAARAAAGPFGPGGGTRPDSSSTTGSAPAAGPFGPSGGARPESTPPTGAGGAFGSGSGGYGGAPAAAAGGPGGTGYGGQAGGAGAAADSERARAALNRLRSEVGKVVVGQDPAVTGLVIALLCRGHVLLEGVPGVAKTLMVRALSASLALETKRLQFTPDLMPGDVTGSLIYDARNAEFSFRPGPVFTNLLLADEINRTPPKTQASLLEAMEERQVSVEGEPRMLPDPFIVVATQNPIEYEGTYPLPEAQLDRFLLKLTVPLPSRDEEFRVLNNHHRGFDPRDLRAAGVTKVADAADLAAGRAAVRGVQAAAEVLAYVVDLCRATRQSPSLSLGASPRGATALLSTAKAWAWLSGRDYVTPDDVKALARPTLRHRVAVRPEAELEGVTADGVLDSVLASVPAPR